MAVGQAAMLLQPLPGRVPPQWLTKAAPPISPHGDSINLQALLEARRRPVCALTGGKAVQTHEGQRHRMFATLWEGPGPFLSQI